MRCLGVVLLVLVILGVALFLFWDQALWILALIIAFGASLATIAFSSDAVQQLSGHTLAKENSFPLKVNIVATLIFGAVCVGLVFWSMIASIIVIVAGVLLAIRIWTYKKPENKQQQ